MQHRKLSQRWAYWLVYHLTRACKDKAHLGYQRAAALARAEMMMHLAQEAIASKHATNG